MKPARLRHMPHVLSGALCAGVLTVGQLLLAQPALAAGVLGAWQVKGEINGHPFTAACDFTPAASGFGGVCVDNNNKKHVLTTGTVNGSAVTFSYQANYMMMSFAVNFTGTLQGDAMSGTVLAAGRNGDFAAKRG